MLCHSAPAFASDFSEKAKSKGVVANVQKGNTVPFDGVLLSNTAAAKLFGDLNFFEEECKLTLAKELDIVSIRHKAEVSALKLKLDIEVTRTESLINIKNERIQFLEENWRPQPWYESGEFWMAVGVVSGVLLTVGTAHAINQTSR